MAVVYELSEAEVARALREAKARGLPDGWTVKLDKRRRRKWIAPSGKSCDSIPKAIAISIELGLLPPDTPIPISSRKRALENASSSPAAKKKSSPKSAPKTAPVVEDPPESDSAEFELGDYDTDPETTFDPSPRGQARGTTVHWDPDSPEGRVVGWRTRVYDGNTWREGRILRYDPYTYKHKMQFDDPKIAGLDREGCIWLRIPHETVQCAVRLVWAHVKGFAWWPAMIMDGDALEGVNQKRGHLLVAFFASDEVAALRDSPDCIRDFDQGKVDSVISKNKKKRNPKAIKVACEEQHTIQLVRNRACRHYAEKSFHLANAMGLNLLGKRVQIFRSDVNYPYGDTVIGVVRQYNPVSKLWLLAYEMSEKTKNKYEASWVNLHSREYDYKVFDRKKRVLVNDERIVPFVRGFRCLPVDGKKNESDENLAELLAERCSACVEYILPNQRVLKCKACDGRFHHGCVHSSTDSKKGRPSEINADSWVCARCRTCSGCHRKDVSFGCHPYTPGTVNQPIPEDDPLDLCLMCTKLYDKRQYCPNCAHTWNDVRYQRLQNHKSHDAVFEKGKSRRRKRAGASNNADDVDDEVEMDPSVPVESEWYYPDTSIWGYTAGNMLSCDECSLWVHAGCAGMSRDEYDKTSSGKHKIYSKEFLCRLCCKKRSNKLLDALRNEDKMSLFAVPVTPEMAPTYHDIIKKPMDLETMTRKSKAQEHFNYAWIREDFELMVLNALTFNRFHSTYWNEAKRYYHECMKNVFIPMGKGAPPGLYKDLVDECFKQAERHKKMEEERVQQDKTTEKKDLVAGAQVATITLPSLRDPPDQPSCLPFTEVKLKPLEAHFASWMECCFTCGSSGAADTMLFCVDCGEAFHAFCVNAPILSMETSSVSGWRCPNCKICELSGEVPHDELKMLFCEMCDRAFSLDLIDPPLNSAPSGLWICGQCVDCKECGDPGEASIRYWSLDPHKCYQCGGCQGVEPSNQTARCGICSEMCRNDDTGTATCKSCKVKVHVRCDPIAAKRASAGDGPKLYECPSCRKTKGNDKHTGTLVRQQLRTQAWQLVTAGTLPPHPEFSHIEMHDKLCQEIDWRTRNMWREEYRNMVKEGFRLISVLKERNLSWFTVLDACLAGKLGLPKYMGHRAARFVQFSKHSKWIAHGFPKKNIEALVVVARMAGTFITVACRALGSQPKKALKTMERLVVSPDAYGSGLVDIPLDIIKVEGNRNILQNDELLRHVGPAVDSPSGINSKTTTEAVDPSVRKTRNPDKVDYIISKPVRGWNKYLPSQDENAEWKDPRMCCLCRTFGDDDGDSAPLVYAEGEPPVARMGRLLPMPDSLWVHASCALWSSEVYEAATGGTIHSMEKARSRGSQLKCFGCGRPGASVGCFKANCYRNYHFTCAKACGAVFTEQKQMFCMQHRSHATCVLVTESVEHMKSLRIAIEKKSAAERNAIEAAEASCLPRVGSLTVHSFGEIEQTRDGFHSEKYLTPVGYTATRIFWSALEPKTRTVYVLKIARDQSGGPLFTVTAADQPSKPITGKTANEVYSSLVSRVHRVNNNYFSRGNVYSKLPVRRKTNKKTFGLNGAQFFGYGLNHIRKRLEGLPGIEAVVAPLSESSPSYRFCFKQPTLEAVMGLQRERAAAAAESALENTSGCARTEGVKAVARSGGSGRITRALVRSADGEPALLGKRTDAEERKAKADRESNQQKYKEMKSVPVEERLVARRSHIHGWGLFCKIDLPKDAMIVEYVGEAVRQCIGDKREKAYETSGIGSCYMFRLDLQRIVDATRIGSMARFMNHCCQPNAYAKVITVETDLGQDKKIVVFANRSIAAGEEITYDYKFPVEDGSLRCTCGAPNCIGRMN